jgi:hypothetical protein
MEPRVTISALEADADTLLEIVVMSEREVQARGSLAALPTPAVFGAASAIVADPLGPTSTGSGATSTKLAASTP